MRVDDVASIICQALRRGAHRDGREERDGGRGLHSFTFQLNLSRV
jgi:hypothetical protein